MDSHTSSISLFQPPQIESAILEESYIQYRPTASISKGSVIEFSLPGTGTEYINLKKSRLHVKAKILKPDGTAVADTDIVAFKNHMSTLFRQVDVMLNQKTIAPDTSVNYPYKTLIDVLLNFSHDAKESQLSGELYYKDSPGRMDDVPKNGNGGATDRYNLSKSGGIVSMEGPIHSDICMQDKLILNGVPITFRFHQSSDQFRLICDGTTGYQSEITEVYLKVCQVKLNPKVMIAHDEALNLGDAIYEYWRSNIKTFTVAKGTYAFSTDDFLCGTCPSNVYVTLVRADAYAGSYSKNPYNFQNFDLNYIQILIDGNSVGPALQPNYSTKDYTESFLSVFGDRYPAHGGNWLWRSDYPAGYTIYRFKIEGQVEPGIMTLPKKAHTRLNIRFTKALPEAVTVIVYSQYPSLMKINKARDIIQE